MAVMTRRASTVCLYSESNTGAGMIDRQHTVILGPIFGSLRASFSSRVYLFCTSCWGMTDTYLNSFSHQVSSPDMDLGPSLSRSKHGTGCHNFGKSYAFQCFGLFWLVFRWDLGIQAVGWASLLYESSGGNQVDGLPPVAHTAEG